MSTSGRRRVWMAVLLAANAPFGSFVMMSCNSLRDDTPSTSDAASDDATIGDAAACVPDGASCVGAPYCCTYNTGALVDLARGCVVNPGMRVALACSIHGQCGTEPTEGCFQRVVEEPDGGTTVETYAASTDSLYGLAPGLRPCAQSVYDKVVAAQDCED